jgi:hypothetical protein
MDPQVFKTYFLETNHNFIHKNVNFAANFTS